MVTVGNRSVSADCGTVVPARILRNTRIESLAVLEGTAMTVQITPTGDPRVEKILQDPITYFNEARAELRQEVELEISRERSLP